jgi:tetratricopeptide (TPR) repeat protein
MRGIDMNTYSKTVGFLCLFAMTMAGLAGFHSSALRAQAAASQVAAPAVLNSLRGRVFMEGDDGTTAIRVMLRHAQGSEVGTAKAKYDGSFAFESLAPGEYLLVMEREGFPTIARPVQIKTYSSPKTIYLQIRLSADGSTTVRELVKEYSREDLPQHEETRSKVSKEALKEFQRAEQESSRGNHSRAIEHLKKALRAEPKFYEAWNNLGLQYQAIQAWEQAIEAFRQATATGNNSAKPSINLGNLLLALNQLDPALESFKQASKIDPDSVVTHTALGKIYVLKQDFLSAHEHLEMATRLDPKGSREAFLLLARLEINGRDIHQACRTLKAMLEFFPTDPDARAMMSELPDCRLPAEP